MKTMINGNKAKRLLSLFVSLVLCVIAALPVAAYPAHTDYISDEATVLDEQTENTVRELSAKLKEAKNTRIALCTVLNTGSDSAEKYASDLFETWEVGHGVLLLLDIEGDTFYAVQSNSLTEVLTNQKLSDIINSTVEPRFAEQDYSGGALAAAQALSTFLNENLPEDFGEEDGGMPTWLSVILKIILVVAIIILAGYGLLVYFERRKALRRRAELEERRRRMAREGRGAYPPRRPAPSGDVRRRPPAGQPYGRPNGSYPAGYPRVRNGNMERTGQFDPAGQRRRPAPRGYGENAATVQINTADIRAARNNRRY